MIAMRSLVVASLVLCACGARTAGSVGKHDAGSNGSDAAATEGNCVHWSLAGAAVVVSPPPPDFPDDDVGLADAIATPRGAIVAWTTPWIDRPQTLITRRIAWDLATNGDARVVLGPLAPNTGSGGSFSLATGHGHAAVSADLPSGPVVRPLTLDGAPNGTMVSVAAKRTSNLYPTESGFDLFVATKDGNYELGRLDVQKLDPSGASLERAKLFSNEQWIGPYGWSRATLTDGTFIATTRTSTKSVFRVIGGHFDAKGLPLSPQQTIANLDIVSDGDFTTRIVPVTGGVLAAWTQVRQPLAEELVVQPLHLDASADGDASVFASIRGFDAFDLASDVSGNALLAWGLRESPIDDAGSLHLLELDPHGAPRNARIDLPQSTARTVSARSLRVVTEGKRGFVLYVGQENDKPRRVYAQPLSCGP